ncbi:MAG: hypothetical protein H6765_07155 [Candidatus Peribacteria bacterium]|nr:MAG: hypothetical protein H6765_07155 [Candidatus Peribacteria bacterium]
MAADWALGGEAQAIRIIFYVALLASVIIIGIYYNIKLPMLQFELIKDAAASAKRTATKSRASTSKEADYELDTEVDSPIAKKTSEERQQQTMK